MHPFRDIPVTQVALAGNPNAGKTSTFNALTGSSQHVGNYPGITVEKRTGSFSAHGRRVNVVDLPGTYSLTSFSPEERIARDELLSGEYDVVVVVADSTVLKRSLVLMVQVMQTGANPVLCLNMTDEAEKAGQQIDVALMEELLGFPVVQTVGHRGGGAKGLIDAIERARLNPVKRSRLVLGDRMDKAVAAIEKHLQLTEIEARAKDWLACRLLAGDDLISEQIKASPAALEEAITQREKIELEIGHDIALFVSERYFGFVDGLLREVVQSSSRADARHTSDMIDRVFVHRIFGLPIFAAIMYSIFWLTFTVGEFPMQWIEAGFTALQGWLSGLWPAGENSQLQSLLIDGVIAGVGGVLVFLPNILLLFLGLAFLEDSGYMARAAFLMDKVMHRFGLHGKSFVPMMTGFGCSVPGIMATRTLENERDRLTTMLVLPLMSCGARLPIWMLLIPAFFAPAWRAPALWFIYSVGIIMALVLALVLRKSVLAGEEAPFVMELPPYRLPTYKAVAKKIGERAWIYMRKAGTIILSVSILMWFLTTYPKKDSYDVDAALAAGTITLSEQAIDDARAAEGLRYSAAGRIGEGIEPVIRPLGFDWKIGASLVGALAAKEVFVSQMGIVYAVGQATEESIDLRDQLAQDYPPLVGLSLMLFLLISAPCMATIAVTRRESGSWKWAILQLGGLTAVGYLSSLVVFQIGRLFL